MDNIKKAIEEAKCTVALDENDEMVTLDEPRYYFTKDGLFTLLEMISSDTWSTALINFTPPYDYEDFFDYWQQTLKALKE